MGKRLFISVVFVLCGLGVLMLSSLLHEGIHVLQGSGVERMCIDFGDGSRFMHVEGKSFNVNTEWWAYGIELVFLLVCLGYMIFYTKKVIDE